MLVGYPGLSKVVVGGRGFLRATLAVRGQATHTGGKDLPFDGNAVEKAALLVRALGRHRTPTPPDPDLGLPARLTVTAVHGGQGYSIVPDRCEVHIDVRLTPSLPDASIAVILNQLAAPG